MGFGVGRTWTLLRAAPPVARIATARLVLRPVVRDDASAFAAHLCDLDVSRWLARVPHPYTRKDAEAFIEHVAAAGGAGTAVTFAIAPLSDPETAIGVVAVHGLDGTPEFGYWLGKPWWGGGLMTEAAGTALTWMFANLKTTEIVSGAFVGNERSLRIQKRLGFKVAGHSRRECQALGRTLDHVDTRISRDHPPPG